MANGHTAEVPAHTQSRAAAESTGGLVGRVPHQLLEELSFMEEKISKLEQRIQECMRPYQHAISLWTSMPGIRELTAWSLVAEIGTNPEQFSPG
jgi:hypothetical protein